MKPDPAWQKTTALSHIATLRAQINGQPAPDRYFAEKAAIHVGARVTDVENWMRGK